MGGVVMVVGGMVRKEEENFESSATFEHRGTTPLKNRGLAHGAASPMATALPRSNVQKWTTLAGLCSR